MLKRAEKESVQALPKHLTQIHTTDIDIDFREVVPAQLCRILGTTGAARADFRGVYKTYY